MRCLVIVAHPLQDSLSHRFARLACETLAEAGNETRLVDLHAEGFDPCLSARERAAYYDPPHAHDAIADQAELLRRAELLVLAFPTWWFGPPAILKGWMDRVFAPGVAYDHAPDFGPIAPRLTGLRRAIAVTTLGTPWWVDSLVMRRPVRRVLKTAVIGACAPRARFDYLPFHSAERPQAARIAAFEKRLSTLLAR